MNFKAKLIMSIFVIVLVGAIAAFLFLPKGTSESSVIFIVDKNVSATVSGRVTGNANSLELSGLTYSDGMSPTGKELSSWNTDLEFGDGAEITLSILIFNNADSILYISLIDNSAFVSNLTKTIEINTEAYSSGTLVMVQGGFSYNI